MMLKRWLFLIVFFSSFMLGAYPSAQVAQLKKIMGMCGYMTASKSYAVRDVYINCSTVEEWQTIKQEFLKKYKNSENLRQIFLDVELQKMSPISLSKSPQTRQSNTERIYQAFSRSPKEGAKIVSKLSINTSDRDGTALIEAVRHSDTVMVERLLKFADPNISIAIAPGQFRSALDVALERLVDEASPIEYTIRYAILRQLLDKNAIPTVYCARLLIRSGRDKLDMLNRFIAHGLDLTMRGKKHITLATDLLRIVDDRELELAKFLIANGADISSEFYRRNKYMSQPFIYFKIRKYLAGNQDTLGMIKLLVDSGAELNKWPSVFNELNSILKTNKNNLASLAYYLAEHGAQDDIAALASALEKQQPGQGFELLKRYECVMHERAAKVNGLDDYEALITEMKKHVGFNAVYHHKIIQETAQKIVNNFIDIFVPKSLEKHFSTRILEQDQILPHLISLQTRLKKYEYYTFSPPCVFKSYIDYRIKQIDALSDGTEAIHALLELNTLSEMLRHNGRVRGINFYKELIVSTFKKLSDGESNIFLLLDCYQKFAENNLINRSTEAEIKDYFLGVMKKNLMQTIVDMEPELLIEFLSKIMGIDNGKFAQFLMNESPIKNSLSKLINDKLLRYYADFNNDLNRLIYEFLVLVDFAQKFKDSLAYEVIFNIINQRGQRFIEDRLCDIEAGDVNSLYNLMLEIEPFNHEHSNLSAAFKEKASAKVLIWINEWLSLDTGKNALFGSVHYVALLEERGVFYKDEQFHKLVLHHIKSTFKKYEIKDLSSLVKARDELRYFVAAKFISLNDAQLLLSEPVKRITLSNLTARLFKYDQALSFEAPPGECDTCGNQGLRWHCGALNQGCKGIVCQECLTNITAVAFEKVTLGGIPQCSFCHHMLVPDFFKQGERAYRYGDQFREALLRNIMRRDLPDWRFCHNADCLNGASYSKDEKQRFDCDACLFAGCLICGKDHDGCRHETVDFLLEYGRRKPPEREIKDPDDRHFYDGRYRPCAFCGVMSERAGGCNGMQCTSCGKKWHWNKGLKSTAHDSINAEMEYEPLSAPHF